MNAPNGFGLRFLNNMANTAEIWQIAGTDDMVIARDGTLGYLPEPGLVRAMVPKQSDGVFALEIADMKLVSRSSIRELDIFARVSRESVSGG